MNENKVQAASMLTGAEPVQAQPLLFALDIGTRSVIGVLGTEESGLLRVIDVAVREHAKRAMIDGQIEDIPQVAQVARAVREEIEQRQGVQLRRVCVAAAGRALKTIRAVGELHCAAQRVLSARDVYELERDAVDKARSQLLEEGEQTNDCTSFYCVGHAVVRYDLDGYAFNTIKGHKALNAQAEVIATFLPSAVVESLYTAMELAGMQVESVTLEPIAAMNAVIPQELRLLNLALVDVGAGTSDIAISEGGSVSAYTMATTAGDEISEELIRTCLVDFATAEHIKQAAGVDDSNDIVYENILGMSDTMSRTDALARIRPAVEALASTICNKIQEANGGKAPTAVFLVGGGSKTPFLSELVAQGLGLEAGKVALGGGNLFKRLAVSSKEIAGPEFATPLGIAITAINDESRESFFVQVNDNQVLAVYSKEMTALDVLLMAGYKYTDLMGTSGKGLNYTLDGLPCRERGERFQPATLCINDAPAAISDPVHRGDSLTVVPAVHGEAASLTIGQLLERKGDSFFVLVNGEKHPIARVLLRNGNPTQPTDPIVDGDELFFVPPVLADVCSLWGLEPSDWTFLVGGKLAPLTAQLQYADEVEWESARGGLSVQKQLVHSDALTMQAVMDETKQSEISAWGGKLKTDAAMHTSSENQEQPMVAVGNYLRVTVNGKQFDLPKRDAPYQFLDLLTLSEMDFNKPEGDVLLLHNGHEASYLDLITSGDDIVIGWKEREML